MEEDPDDLVDCCLECIEKAVEQLEKDGKYKVSDIKGMGITNQRGGARQIALIQTSD